MKRWWVVVAVVWGLVVAGLAYYSYRTDPPTARDQTTIADGLPTVDRILAEIAAAVDPATTVVAIGGYTRVGRTCEVTTAREGTRYERVLRAYTKKDTEHLVLERVRAALRDDYEVSALGGGRRLVVDAGDFVAVQGTYEGEGMVRFVADTGCRVQDARVTDPALPSDAADRAPVQAVLDTLKVSAGEWRTFRATCPAGGTLSTVETTAGRVEGSLVDVLGPAVPDGSAVLATPDVHAFRTGATGVTVRKLETGVVVTATTGCG